MCFLVYDGNSRRLSQKWFYGEAGNRTCDPFLFCGFPGYKPVPPGWFKVCVGFITGTPRPHRKLFFMEKPGIEPATPGLQGVVFVPRLVTAVDA